VRQARRRQVKASRNTFDLEGNGELTMNLNISVQLYCDGGVKQARRCEPNGRRSMCGLEGNLQGEMPARVLIANYSHSDDSLQSQSNLVR
jgi:hypothetical protein